MADPIRHDEWLKELSALTAKSDEGMTTRELARAAGVSERTMGDRLRDAHEMGWVTYGKRSIIRRNGRPGTTDVYIVRVPGKGGRGK